MFIGSLTIKDKHWEDAQNQTQNIKMLHKLASKLSYLQQFSELKKPKLGCFKG